MIGENYDVKYSPDFLTFEFISTGPRGSITKVVKYSGINIKGYYNLGFGDKDEITGFISDLTVSNNADSQKILATVAATLYAFTEKYPDALVLATGSTEARTRLYRIGISNNLEAIEKDFLIFGLSDTGWEKFSRNITYGAFMIKRKW